MSKNFFSTADTRAQLIWGVCTCDLYYKCFTIVINDHNDSGQYYKTTTMIVIDDHN